MPSQNRDATESGVLVYPRMPVPKQRDGESRTPPPPKKGSRMKKILAGVIGGVLLGGIAAGMVLRPIVAPDPRIAELEGQVAEAGSAAAASKARSDGLEKELDVANAQKRDVEKRLEVASKAETRLADTAAEAEKKKSDLAAVQKKLATAMKGAATVAVDGDDLKLTINSALLFSKDDALSERGKQIVERVGTAVKDMSDKLVSINGHTDDTPLPLPKTPAAPPPPKKGGKPAPAPAAPPPPRFATNWELSAGRAVAVLRQLQEISKLDPARLSSAGFGQYRPVSRRDKAANRRIEIVLSPKPPAKQ